jgi:hypothetical protein
VLVKSIVSKALGISLFFVVAALLAHPVFAITDEEIFRDFRFNFGNPGARALAMGGAFTAIANDATAAQANPARLAVLRRAEIFAEMRNRITDDTTRDTGQFAIDPTVNPEARLSLQAAVEPDPQTTPSVVSFVWPFKLRRALTVGFSRQEILSVKSETQTGFREVPLNSSPFQDPNAPEEFSNASAGSIESDMVFYNLAAGYQLTRDLFVGGSIVFATLDVQSSIISTFSDPTNVTGLSGNDPKFQTPQGAPLISTDIDDSGNDVSWSLGLFWKLNDYLSFGTVYKKGVKIGVDERVTVDPNAFSTVGFGSGTLENTFATPDVSGFGVAWRPFAKAAGKSANLVFATDLVRVENQDLVQGFTPQLNVITLPGFIKKVEFTADNQTEIHVGGEYYMPLGRTVLALRGGFYTDPDNTIHDSKVISDGTPQQEGTKTAILKGDIFPERSSENHYTGGFGVSFGEWEIAAAYDKSNIETQGLFSVIYRFKK